MSEKLNALVTKGALQEDIADNILLRHELVIERIISEHKISSLRRESQINALHAERRRLQTNIETLNHQLAETQTQQRATAQERDDLAERLAVLDQAHQTLNDQLAEARTQHQTLNDQLAEARTQHQTLNDQLAEARTQHQTLNDQLAEARTQHQTLNDQLAEARTQHQTLNDQLAEARTQHQTLNDQLAEARAQHQTLNDQLAEARAQHQTLNDQLAEARTQHQTLNDQLAEARTQQRATVRERDGLVSTLSKMESHQSVVEKMAREVFKSFDDLQRRELRARNEANLLRNKLDRIQHQHAYRVGQAIVSNLRGPRGWTKIPGAVIEANKVSRLDQINFVNAKKIEPAYHMFSGSVVHLSLISSWQSLRIPAVDVEKEIWITALTTKPKISIELEIEIYPLDSSSIGGVSGSTTIQRLIIEAGSPTFIVLLSSSNASLCLKFRRLDGPLCIVKFELRNSRTNKYVQPVLSIHNSQTRILSHQQEPNEPKAVLFFCVNGAGLGHLTRSLAIARRLRRLDPKIPLRFLTSSSAVNLIEAEGIPAHHIPPAQTAKKKIPTGEWNALLLKTIRQIHAKYRPRLLVYDGVFPYKGLLDAISLGTFDRAVMVLRLRHKNNMLAEKADLLARFDKLIFPGEAGEDHLSEALPPELRELPHECVDPIIFLEPNELLPRASAREALKIDPTKRAVFVQLGAGNINDTCSWTDHILDTLARRSDVDVVLAESPIANQPHAIREGVHILQQYPNSKYFNAFDLAITAVGYNTFHELMYFGVPSILIPNQETKTDDQVQRAMVAHHARAAIAILRPEDLADAISLALTDEVAKTMREKSRALVPSNGVETVAKYLREVAMEGIPDQIDVVPALIAS